MFTRKLQDSRGCDLEVRTPTLHPRRRRCCFPSRRNSFRTSPRQSSPRYTFQTRCRVGVGSWTGDSELHLRFGQIGPKPKIDAETCSGRLLAGPGLQARTESLAYGRECGRGLQQSPANPTSMVCCSSLSRTHQISIPKSMARPIGPFGGDTRS